MRRANHGTAAAGAGASQSDGPNAGAAGAPPKYAVPEGQEEESLRSADSLASRDAAATLRRMEVLLTKIEVNTGRPRGD